MPFQAVLSRCSAAAVAEGISYVPTTGIALARFLVRQTFCTFVGLSWALKLELRLPVSRYV